MLYAALHPTRISKLTGSQRMGSLAFDKEDWRDAIIEQTAEIYISPFGRDPIKDFKAPPSTVKLVYHYMTGKVYRLLGSQMKVLEAATHSVSVRMLQKILGKNTFCFQSMFLRDDKGLNIVNGRYLNLCIYKTKTFVNAVRD